MDAITHFIDFFIHLDKYLNLVIQNYGVWTYLILWLIIFCETGLVVTPILPGDSLIFAAGAFAATGSLKIGLLLILLMIAAIAGNTVNYWIGYIAGPKIFQKDNVRLFKKEYLDRAHRFYEKYGGKTIIITRFLPIIRTFAPFVAGISRMTFSRFIIYNIIGGVSWVASFGLAGYYFGNIPSVKNNFTLVILAIIFISLLPSIIEFIRRRLKASKIKSANNNHPAIIKAILFDFDGVVVDSFATVHEIYKVICKKLGKQCPEDIEEFRRLYGYTYEDALKNLNIEPKDYGRVEEIFTAESAKREPKLFEGIVEVLRQLKCKYRLVLVSSNYTDIITKKLTELTGQDIFDFIIARQGASGGHFKKTEPIKNALAKLQARNDEIVFIADRTCDYIEAKEAGVQHIIMVDYGWGYEKDRLAGFRQKIVVEKPTDILKALESLT